MFYKNFLKEKIYLIRIGQIFKNLLTRPGIVPIPMLLLVFVPVLFGQFVPLEQNQQAISFTIVILPIKFEHIFFFIFLAKSETLYYLICWALVIGFTAYLTDFF